MQRPKSPSSERVATIPTGFACATRKALANDALRPSCLPRPLQSRPYSHAPESTLLETASSGYFGVYPGSFNPPTKAHLEIALAAVSRHSLERLDLALSAIPLGKAEVEVPSFAHRLEVIEQSLSDHERLAVVVTEAQLIADIADGYDVVVMGADKWHQVNDPAWYDNDAQARDRAVDRLPTVALAPRPPHSIPAELKLPVPNDLVEISSTAARAGNTDQMTTAAAQFDAETGAWTDPARYQRWRAAGNQTSGMPNLRDLGRGKA